MVTEAFKEANIKGYGRLLVIGCAIQSNGRLLIEQSEGMGIPATYIQATPDLLMGDLLKNMRSSQIFSICGLPDIKAAKIKTKKGEEKKWEVRLVGVDTFDPITMKTDHMKGDDVPAWDKIKKALKGSYADTVWDHLVGDTSAPFTPGANRCVAVKVIDDRGNELSIEKHLDS